MNRWTTILCPGALGALAHSAAPVVAQSADELAKQTQTTVIDR